MCKANPKVAQTNPKGTTVDLIGKHMCLVISVEAHFISFHFISFKAHTLNVGYAYDIRAHMCRMVFFA